MISSIPKIALFGNRNSVQVAAVRDAVLAEGGEPILCDIQLGGSGQTTVSMGEGQAMWNGINFADIEAIFIRCTAPNTLPTLPPMLNAVSHTQWRLQFMKEQFYQSSIFSFFNYLAQQGKLVINPLTGGYIDHDSKAQFYEKLRAKGFQVPRTLTTNEPDRARLFLEQHSDVVVKPAIGVGSTRVVTKSDRERLKELSISPVLMQEQIQGQTLRVHIVGNRVVLALRILGNDGVDSRTGEQIFEYVKLPDEEEKKIVQANRYLGLHFAAWDIIESPSGEYFYLDCNPGPYVMWIGPDFVKAVFKQLAKYLITFAKTKSLEESASVIEPCCPNRWG
ncbi:MAG: ATP-grasp domain-containing protein [Magnetococcales bacterium]|nr:ATP-grasp domain-containing protein [Magnetococcales bacterium]